LPVCTDLWNAQAHEPKFTVLPLQKTLACSVSGKWWVSSGVAFRGWRKLSRF